MIRWLILALLVPHIAFAQSGGSGVSFSGVSFGGSGGGGGGSFACNDTVDNDSDGIIDYPGDMGCSSPFDNDESGDNLVVVGANLTATALNNCINGTDQGGGSTCNNVSNSKLTNTTVCGNATSSSSTTTCSSPTLRSITTTGYTQLSNTSYNNISVTNTIFEQAGVRWVDSELYGDGNYPSGISIESGNDIVIHSSTVDGMSHPTLSGYCRDFQMTLRPDRFRATDSYFTNWCPNSDAPGDDHAEVFWIATGSNDGFIGGNTFVYNGGTAHIFFSGTGDPADYGANWCIKDNEFGSRWGGTLNDISLHGPVSGSTIYIETSNVPISGNPNFPSNPIDTQNDDGFRACRQCNDGLDNDSDGRADYWPDGNGDTNCTDKADNTEN